MDSNLKQLSSWMEQKDPASIEVEEEELLACAQVIKDAFSEIKEKYQNG